MTFDSDSFLDALATLLVERAAALSPAVQIEYETTPRELWIHQANEGDAAACFSVLRVYGGPARPQVPLRWNSIQCDTRAGSSRAKAAMSKPAKGESGVKKFREASPDEVRAFLDSV